MVSRAGQVLSFLRRDPRADLLGDGADHVGLDTQQVGAFMIVDLRPQLRVGGGNKLDEHVRPPPRWMEPSTMTSTPSSRAISGIDFGEPA